MPTSSSFTEARLAFGKRLRRLREDSGLSARELARRCGWHESKCSRIENGHVRVSTETIEKWARACGAEALIDELIEAARGIEGMYVEWQEMERSGLRQAQDTVRPLWDRTKRFRAYAQNLIPGPLQTPEYTRAVLAGIRERRHLPDDIEAAVAVREERQTVLNEQNKAFHIVLEEGALYRRIGSPELMTNQLGRLIQISVLPHVRLGIIPRDADRSRMPPVEDFWIFDDRQVNVELVSAYLTVKQTHEIKLYTGDFRRLSDLAEHGGPVFALIASAINSYS
ncbi:helix-turn-helix domain-containing protein [Streptomyces sp. S1]|uniref:helix-turn-helix domain-containing protein n=1 Tax=Streptomyces sp. S1 TaxID=718288 RepID=UPI003D74D200